ncbi:unnamed protein product [Urochloa humidicola]
MVRVLCQAVDLGLLGGGGEEAHESKRDVVRGLVLLNCGGGMNNKAIVDDWSTACPPLLWRINFLLKQRPIASHCSSA